MKWYALTGEDRRAAKAADDANRRRQIESAEWIKCATLNHSISLYRIPGTETRAYRGTVGQRVFHSFTGGDEAERRRCWLLSQSDWLHLPPRFRVAIPPYGFLELRRGPHRAICLTDRAMPSLYAAVDTIREMEQQ